MATYTVKLTTRFGAVKTLKRVTEQERINLECGVFQTTGIVPVGPHRIACSEIYDLKATEER